MKRITDDRGLLPYGAPVALSKWQHAQVKKERDELSFEQVCAGARETVERKMRGQKLTGKPRLRIFPRKTAPEAGNWYVLYVGRWFIRCKSWENLVRRAAYGPWTKMPSEYTPYRKPNRSRSGELCYPNGEVVLQLTDVRRDRDGRVVSGAVVNGAWDLRADHAEGVFWSTAFPERRYGTDLFIGWAK